MNIGAIIIATVVVAAVGLFIGIFLGVAGKKFAVETDEKEIAVREALPGNNCGGCGFPGCDGLAAAIAKGEAPVNGCPVGGDSVGRIIAGIMGQEVKETARQVAYVNVPEPAKNKKRLSIYRCGRLRNDGFCSRRRSQKLFLWMHGIRKLRKSMSL